ncbi:MAG: hypothetical protein CBD47_06485 [Synechococcus sp. TMED187]|nr:MAG: hypothetical protein CBD47_06485 [Synechococcus sp. TMED187]
MRSINLKQPLIPIQTRAPFMHKEPIKAKNLYGLLIEKLVKSMHTKDGPQKLLSLLQRPKRKK